MIKWEMSDSWNKSRALMYSMSTKEEHFLFSTHILPKDLWIKGFLLTVLYYHSPNTASQIITSQSPSHLSKDKKESPRPLLLWWVTRECHDQRSSGNTEDICPQWTETQRTTVSHPSATLTTNPSWSHHAPQHYQVPPPPENSLYWPEGLLLSCFT